MHWRDPSKPDVDRILNHAQTLDVTMDVISVWNKTLLLNTMKVSGYKHVEILIKKAMESRVELQDPEREKDVFIFLEDRNIYALLSEFKIHLHQSLREDFSFRNDCVDDDAHDNYNLIHHS